MITMMSLVSDAKVIFKMWLHNGHSAKGRSSISQLLIEPRCEKTDLRCFRPGPTQTGLYSHGRWLEALNVGFRQQRDRTIHVAKTKTLISCAVTAQLICVFVFAYAKIRFSHDAAQL